MPIPRHPEADVIPSDPPRVNPLSSHLAAMAREHYSLENALERHQPPDFDNAVRKTLSGFALRWIWEAHRLIKAFLDLQDNKPMPT